MLTLALVGVVVQQSADPLANDPRLAKTIELHSKIESLANVAESVSRQTGVEILCAPNVADRKVTALIKGKSLSEFMKMLASLERGEWQREKAAYRLVVSLKVQTEESMAVAEERRLARAKAEKDVKSWSLDCVKTKEQRKQEEEELQRELEQVPDPKDKGAVKVVELSERISQLRMMDGQPSRVAAGYLFRKFSSTEWNQFWAGKTYLASSDDHTGILKIPLTAGFRSDGGQIPSKHAQYVSVHFDAEAGEVKAPMAEFTEYGEGNHGSATGSSSSDYLRQVTEEDLANQPLIKWARGWRTLLKTDLPVFGRPVDLKRDTPKSDYYGKVFNLADMWEWLSTQSDVQILSEAYRVSMPTYTFARADTVREWLRSVLTDRGGGYLHADGDWLLFRYDRFWRRNPKEAPERALVPFEKVAASRVASIDDYAFFVSKLTDSQARQCGEPFDSCVRFWPFCVNEATQSLRVWSLLTNDQHKSLLGATPLLASAMPPDAQKLFYSILNEAVRRTLAADEPLIVAAASGADPSLDEKLGFRFAPESSSSVTSRFLEPMPLNGYDNEAIKDFQSNCCVFQFGAEGRLSLTQSTTFPHHKWAPGVSEP